MTELTTQDHMVLTAGEEALSLLTNATFANTINALFAEIGNTMLATTFAEKDKREQLYMLNAGLREFVGILNARVTAAETIKQHLASDDNAEAPENN